MDGELINAKGDAIKTFKAQDEASGDVFTVSDLLAAVGTDKDPTANPLFADLSGLPPLYITVGSYETLLDDSTRFEKKARAAGVEVKMDIFPEMQHVWHLMAGAAPEADKAIKQIADWVRPKIGL